MELFGNRRRKRGESHRAWGRVEPIWKGLWNEGLRVAVNDDGSSILQCPPFTVTIEQIDLLVDGLDLHLHSV